MQEFDFEVIDIKGIKYQVYDHLSRLKDEAMRELGDKTEIDYTFPMSIFGPLSRLDSMVRKFCELSD